MSSSPSIDDLDMNLLSSPMPPARGEGGSRGARGGGNLVDDFGDDDIDEDQKTMPSAEGYGNGYNSTASGNLNSFECSVGDPLPSSEQPEYLGNANENEPADEGGPSDGETGDSANERMTSDDGKPTKNYKNMTQMVESWREELYMMNVKNSILLDDLVKLGADI